jgi:hypothetical protein
MLNLKPKLFILSLFAFVIYSSGQETSSLKEGSRYCLKCHGQQTYTIHNTLTDKQEKKLMNPYFVIDSTKLARGVHHSFVCTDCHSADYETYPHSAELKLMPMANCLDCHGGDETYAKYQFERIDGEFRKSIHYQKNGEDFTCSKCHSQHYYKATARNSSNVGEIVAYNNGMCLACHNDVARFNLISDQEKPVLGQVHNWLPNQELHFKNVRCIECHTQVADSLMVSHDILPKERARQNCAECHSANSILKASLYKYQNLQSRSDKGAINAIIQNESYITGANQIPFLKILSIFILLAVFAGVVTHSVLRYLKK